MSDLVQKILGLKKQKKAAIIAHNYQIPAIQDVADLIGDSLELSKKSRDLREEVIVFCGVRFMAETAKILSPLKTILLPVQDAGCPLADTITPKQLIDIKGKYPDAWVVSYVNTSAEIKALSDVCCTSANAITVVKNVPNKKIIFVPDNNLGWWVQKNVPEKEIINWPGGCYVHQHFSLKELEEARANFPEAEVLVHPECPREVVERADFVVSTAGTMRRAKESKAKVFIIGTEEGLIYRLKKENPDKTFYSLGSAKVCVNMKKITLEDLYQALAQEKHKVELDQNIIEKASVALERMVEFV